MGPRASQMEILGLNYISVQELLSVWFTVELFYKSLKKSGDLGLIKKEK